MLKNNLQAKTIGVVCSGGDAPGMNALLYGLCQWASQNNIVVIGFMDGFDGILDEKIKILTPEQFGTNFLVGGSVIGCERSLRFMNLDAQQGAFNILKKYQVSQLIVLGGNGSLQGAYKLFEMGVKVHFIPLTIDNDLWCTKYALGFDTCLNTIVSGIRNILYSSYDHKRLTIIEVMGRNCPALAEEAGTAVQADLVISSNNYKNFDQVVNACVKLNGLSKRIKTVVISENLFDIQHLINKLKTDYQIKAWPVVLGHLQRGGQPSFRDCFFANSVAQRITNNINRGLHNMIYDWHAEITFDSISCEQ